MMNENTMVNHEMDLDELEQVAGGCPLCTVGKAIATVGGVVIGVVTGGSVGNVPGAIGGGTAGGVIGYLLGKEWQNRLHPKQNA